MKYMVIKEVTMTYTMEIEAPSERSAIDKAMLKPNSDWKFNHDVGILNDFSAELITDFGEDTPVMSYRDYLEANNIQDSKFNWRMWKIICCGLTVEEAIEASKNYYALKGD